MKKITNRKSVYIGIINKFHAHNEILNNTMESKVQTDILYVLVYDCSITFTLEIE